MLVRQRIFPRKAGGVFGFITHNSREKELADDSLLSNAVCNIRIACQSNSAA